MSAFTTRMARIDDLTKIVEIYNSIITGRMVTADLTPVTVASREDWFYNHNPVTRPLWVLVHRDREIAGWLSFEDFHPRSAYQKTAELSIYVDENFRGKGLGRLLLTEAVQAAPDLEIENLVGLIFGHNRPSLNLFTSFGFEKWAYLPRVAELDGVKRDLVIVGKHVLDGGHGN